jgi:hypothetical protein
MKEFFDKLKALFMEAEKTLVPDQGAKFTEADVAARVSAKEAEYAEAQKRIDTETRRLADTEKNIKEREAALVAEEAKKRKDNIALFCETLLKAGKLTPAMMKHGMGLAQFMEQVSAIETPMEFSEDKTKKQTALEFIQSFVGALPKAIEFGEVAGDGRTGPGQTGSAGEKLSALTRKKMDEKKMEYAAAFSEVQLENPELAQEYLSEIIPKNKA